MSYCVEVDRRPARMVSVGGASTPVVFFLHTVRQHDYRTETVSDRLNDPAVRFVPCEIDERVELVRIDWIAYVEFDRPPPDFERLDEEGAITSPVRLVLVGGEELDGDLLYEAPPDSARVLDLLNGRSGRFVALRRGDSSLLVNTRAIARIRV